MSFFGTLEATTRDAMKSVPELDRGLAFMNSKVEGLTKLEKDCTAIRHEVLYMKVCQRRETFVFMVLKKTLRVQKTHGKY